MADKEFLGGLTNTTLHFESDGTMHIEEKQDCEQILHYAHAMRNHRFDAMSDDRTMQHVAEIPVVPYLEECRKRNVQPFTREGDLVMEWMLVQPEYSKFLTAPKLRDAHIVMKGVR